MTAHTPDNADDSTRAPAATSAPNPVDATVNGHSSSTPGSIAVGGHGSSAAGNAAVDGAGSFASGNAAVDGDGSSPSGDTAVDGGGSSPSSDTAVDGDSSSTPADVTVDGDRTSAGSGSRLHADAVRVVGKFESPRRQDFLDLLGTSPDTVWREHSGAHLTASALVVAADGERVLLCLHGRFHRWVQMGGHCEPGDVSVAAVALREATEESGIEGLLLSPEPIHLDVHEVVCSGGPSVHFDVQYAAVAPAGAVELVSAESDDVAWFPHDALPAPLASGVEPLVEPARAWLRRIGALT